MRLRRINEDRYMPPPSTKFQFGDCGPEVLSIVQRALRDGIVDLKVVEGMVQVEGDRAPTPHYWIEHRGKIYDPTRSQFGPREIVYDPEGEYREDYTPQQFLAYWKDQYGDLDQ